VGENAFTHESGIHTQGVLANPLTYEPIAPNWSDAKDECRRKTLRLKRHTRRPQHMGLKPTESQFKQIFQRIKELGDKGKTVMDADVLAIAETVMGLGGDKPIQLEEMTYVAATK